MTDTHTVPDTVTESLSSGKARLDPVTVTGTVSVSLEDASLIPGHAYVY